MGTVEVDKAFLRMIANYLNPTFRRQKLTRKQSFEWNAKLRVEVAKLLTEEKK